MLHRCVFAVLLAFVATSQAQSATIVDIVVGSTDHTTLGALVTRAGLVDTLKGAGKFTLFAPTNAAFTALGSSTLVSKLTADPVLDNWKPLLQDVLKYHVLSGRTNSSGLPATATKVDTLSTDSQLEVKNTAPQVTSVAPGAGKAAVVAGGVDLMANNGVVHVVDAVLLPPSTQRNVVNIATNNSDFTTLVELLTAADLVTTLSTDATATAFTVFAPTNAAFGKVDAATITCLKKTENKAVLANLLKYHVVAGTVVAGALTDGQTITSIADTGVKTYKFTSATATLSTGKTDAKITKTDVLGSNGVVHIIDTVLVPSDFACPSGSTPAPSSASQTMTFTSLAILMCMVQLIATSLVF